ncbi:TPA: hypothetical protein N0F65_002785, partial [Lagenidium giganteum]
TLGNVNSNKTVSLEMTSYADVLTKYANEGHAFNYPGSLTTPTCDEIVDWWMIEKPLAVSPADFDQFQKHLERLPATDKGKGARPVQPLNGRTTLGNVNSNKTVSLEMSPYSKVLTKYASQGRAFKYPGSLTVPMCDENVDWWVIEKPLAVSPADFDKFQKHLERLPATDEGKGARPVQPLNGRTVVVY